MAQGHATDGGTGTDRTAIYCAKETRDRVKAQKRGGEDYDSLLRKMVSQYDPEAADE